ncbi:MBL fold metallo-hydrolase [Amycolatopsis sp. NPDC003861]
MSPFDPPAGDSLMFVGTATTVLRLGPFTLLTDPNFLHRGQWSSFGQGLFSRRRTEPALQPADLPPLTAVILSHLHGDHFDRIASRELPRDTPILTTEHAATRLLRRGFHAPLPLPTWTAETFSDAGARLTVTSVPARHAPGPMQRVLPPVMGSVLEYRATPEAEPLRIYLSGDTVIHDELRTIRTHFPDLDLAVVHLGGTRAACGARKRGCSCCSEANSWRCDRGSRPPARFRCSSANHRPRPVLNGPPGSP